MFSGNRGDAVSCAAIRCGYRPTPPARKVRFSGLPLKRSRFPLFVSQDDRALALSESIWGEVPRLGEVNPKENPYRSELVRDQIEVLNLTSLKR